MRRWVSLLVQTLSDAPKASQTKQVLKMTFKHSKWEATNIKTFVFDSSNVSFKFNAGQYIIVKFDDLLDDARGKMRQFSISSSPSESEEHISITTTIEPNDSPFKMRLNSLRQGDEVDILGPFGRFVLPNLEERKEIVMIAGGIGITPFHSMIKHWSLNPYKTTVRLIYSAKNRESLVFKDEFDRLAAANPTFSVRYVLTEPKPSAPTEHVGFIDTQVIENFVPNIGEALFYIAGPPSIVSELLERLTRHFSVKLESIRAERFTGY
jgi:ferredoxin-NADP reductase